MALIISAKILSKLNNKHGVEKNEVSQCFSNREKAYLKDTREDHESDPPTLWFIAETDMGRLLKIAFIHYSDTNDIVIKTAYQANQEEIRIYNKFA